MKQARRTIAVETPHLTHADVSRIAGDVAATPVAPTVVLDVSFVKETETAALAGLVLLRRSLLKKGGDLLLRGIRDRFACLYRLSRMGAVLPQAADQAPAGRSNRAKRARIRP